MNKEDLSLNSIAIAHSQYDVRGGGEIVAEELANTFSAPLFSGFIDEETTGPEDVHEIFNERWQKWLFNRGGGIRDLAHQFLWQQDTDCLYQYDTVLASGMDPIWWVPKEDQTFVVYVHYTPRWCYDKFYEIGGGLKGRIRKLYQHMKRIALHQAIPRPSLWVANSELVKRRLQKYMGIDEEKIKVVYPPVDVEKFDIRDRSASDYYLVLCRLADHKRVEEIVSAFSGSDRKLIVAGTGPEEPRLRQLAGDNVDFCGYVTEEEKVRLLSEAKAYIFNAEGEAFGMSPIEALASGTPVIGVRDGFTKHQISDGKAGILYERGELLSAIERFEREGVDLTSEQIAELAEQYSVESFQNQIRSAVREAQCRDKIGEL